MFLWTVRMQFSQSRRKNFLTQCWWISAQCPKMIADFFREFFFPYAPVDLWTAVLTTLSKRLWQKADFFRSTSETDKKTPKKIFSLNGSFRHVEHSSNNPTERILDKKPKMLRSVSEKDWKDEIFSGKFFSSKCSSGRVKRKFDNTVQSLSRKNQKNFAQALKCPKKFSKKTTPQIVPMDT